MSYPEFACCYCCNYIFLDNRDQFSIHMNLKDKDDKNNYEKHGWDHLIHFSRRRGQ